MNTIPEPITYFSGWMMMRIPECESTNDYSRNLPAWTAVCAQRQSKGRGRFGRAWQSGEGGLWMSAVVPIGIHDERSPLMPLVAGLSVAATLADYGLTDVHLRWPNDVMVHGRKCAGILVERFLPDRCVVGIGVNVLNDPTVEAPELIGSTTRLHDWLEECPDPYMVSVAILSTLRTTLRKMEQEGTAFLLDQLMPYWKVGHRVVVQINGQQESYVFWGVDGAGRVLLSGARGEIRAVAAENINLLRELTT